MDFDAEDVRALAAFVEAAGIALLALDASLRASQPHKRDARPNNLPRQITSFVGRREEIAAVADLVRRNPLVTVSGAGGMGKTRLALQVAERLLDETTEGAWFVDLAPIGDGALVASAVLSALDADQSDDLDPLERIVKHLENRALLLILDNSEHFVADIARVVEAIVARCPGVAILATSREPLGVSGEIVHRLASLDEESASALFADRARAVNQRFELSETNRPAVAEICRHLDGMALAIELAAARVRSISVEELSHRLQLRLLGGFGREPLARHQTMYALIDWSFDLLQPLEQRLFVQLAPFAGGIALETAMSTFCCDDVDEFELLDLITSLVDKSLLVADVTETSQRYRFLKPIREYAGERLDRSADAGAVLQRYARAFADVADRAYEEFDTGPGPDWLERNACELDNVRAALRWSLERGNDRVSAARMAGGFGVVFLRLTMLQEGVEWCDRVLSDDSRFLEPAVEARVLYVLSMLQNNRMRNAEALAAARRALDGYRAADDPRGLVRALSQVAQQLRHNGLQDEAVSKSDEAIGKARLLGDPAVLAGVLARCGNVYQRSDIEKARAYYSESANLYRELGRESERARVVEWRAIVEFNEGNFGTAAELVEDALISAKDDFRADSYALAAGIYWMLRDRDRCASATREALLLGNAAHDPISTSFALHYAAILAADADPAEAARIYGYAERQLETNGCSVAVHERKSWDDFVQQLNGVLGKERVAGLQSEGALWQDGRALAAASAALGI